jgi:hypothetical protein
MDTNPGFAAKMDAAAARSIFSISEAVRNHSEKYFEWRQGLLTFFDSRN